jgi:4-amino-4-deoxy-L-arabinose transferase
MYAPLGVLVFLVVGFSWFGFIVAQDPSRLGYFLGYEVYDRVFTATHDRNAQWYGAFKVYVPMLLVGALPWLVIATVAAGGPGHAWRTLRSRLRERDPQWRLLAYWLLVPLAVFFLARSRLQLYVLPLFVPLALMMARPLARWPGLEGRRGWKVIGVTALALLGIKATLAHWPSNRDSRELSTELRPLLQTHQGDELIFVGMRPFYGLNLYLPQRVDGIVIDTRRYDYSTQVTKAQLCGEIARRQRTVYLLKEHHAPQFEQQLRDCGFVPTRIGSVHADDNDLVLLTVRTGAF